MWVHDEGDERIPFVLFAELGFGFAIPEVGSTGCGGDGLVLHKVASLRHDATLL